MTSAHTSGRRAHLQRARTLLFVPGHRPDRFAKAHDAGADAVIIDLEDAVAPDQKEQAREHTAHWLGGNDPSRTLVRVNAAGTPWFADDIAMAAEHRCPVMLPKADDAGTMHRVADALGPNGLILPLIETPRGVLTAYEVCNAVPHTVAAAFGSVDLATALGVDHTDRTALLHARSTLVTASAAAGIAPPLDGVTTDLDDPRVLESDVHHASSLGFTGKLCVHPRQIDPTHRALAPDAEQRRWALGVVAAAGDGSAARVAGQMIDKPLIERARRILDLSREREQ